jgi:hypothetical protein
MIPLPSILFQGRHAMFPLYLGIKPFACDFCEKSYTDNYSLKQHVAKVSIQRLFILLLNPCSVSVVNQFPCLS